MKSAETNRREKSTHLSHVRGNHPEYEPRRGTRWLRLKYPLQRGRGERATGQFRGAISDRFREDNKPGKSPSGPEVWRWCWPPPLRPGPSLPGGGRPGRRVGACSSSGDLVCRQRGENQGRSPRLPGPSALSDARGGLFGGIIF